MRKVKSIQSTVCESRKMAMPEEINPHGTLFGGVLMSWIDKIGYMCAQNFAEWKLTVTANIDQIKFIAPVYSGDHVVLKAMVTSVGNSSMEINVDVTKEDPVNQSKQKVATAHMTFVCLDENNKPRQVPDLKIISLEDDQLNKMAKLRKAIRGFVEDKILSLKKSPDQTETFETNIKDMLSKFLDVRHL